MASKLAHTENISRTEDVLGTDGESNFSGLYLSDAILSGLSKNGFETPSPIQAKAIPLCRFGIDVILQAKSGTGKTLVFAITTLEAIDVSVDALQAIVIAPTREIAVQIEHVIETIGQDLNGLLVHCFIGGIPLVEDLAHVTKCHVAVGTPGRLNHLLRDDYLKVDYLKLLVLDEADKLMQCNADEIKTLYAKLPLTKQVIASSATYTEQLRESITHYMNNPTFVSPDTHTPVLVGLKQFVRFVKPFNSISQQHVEKITQLKDLLTKVRFTQCIIFTNYQVHAESISLTLNNSGWNSMYITAALSQRDRLNVIENLRNCGCRLVLSTDLTARGIDLYNVDLVINFDIPSEPSTYLHRMGRAGRYGSQGVCITLIVKDKECEKFQSLLRKIDGQKTGIYQIPDSMEAGTDLLEYHGEPATNLVNTRPPPPPPLVAANEENTVGEPGTNSETGDRNATKRSSTSSTDDEDQTANKKWKTTTQSGEKEKLLDQVETFEEKEVYKHLVLLDTVVINSLLNPDDATVHPEYEAVTDTHLTRMKTDIDTEIENINRYFKDLEIKKMLENIAGCSSLWEDSKVEPPRTKYVLSSAIFQSAFAAIVDNAATVTRVKSNPHSPSSQNSDDESDDDDDDDDDEEEDDEEGDDEEEEENEDEDDDDDEDLNTNGGDNPTVKKPQYAISVDSDGNDSDIDPNDLEMFERERPFISDEDDDDDDGPHDTFEDLLRYEMNCEYHHNYPTSPLMESDDSSDVQFVGEFIENHSVASSDDVIFVPNYDDDDDVQFVGESSRIDDVNDNASFFLNENTNDSNSVEIIENDNNDQVQYGPIPPNIINQIPIDLTSDSDTSQETRRLQSNIAPEALVSSYFSYYSELLRNTALTFEDIDSFDRFFYQWRSHMVGTRYFGHQSRYVRVMGDYQYHYQYQQDQQHQQDQQDEE